MDRIQIKELAKKQINGQIGLFFLIYIIIYAIFLVISNVSGILSGCIGVIMELSLFSLYLGIANGNIPGIKNIFDIFKNARLCGNGIILYLLISIYTFLWSILFIIPGIIKGISYSMAPYILIENEYYMSPSDALKESQRIMEGHKMEFLILLLSFIGWYLLGFLTCGIVMFYVDPYINMSIVNFYNQIKDESEII